MSKKKKNNKIPIIGIDFWRWQTMNPLGYKTTIANGHHGNSSADEVNEETKL